MGRGVDDDLFLDPGVHLDRVVDPDAEHDGKTGDGDQRQRDPEEARGAERPDDAHQHDGEREQPPPHVEEEHEDHDHHCDRDPAEGQHAPLEVVVDALEEDRGTGRDGVGAREVEVVGDCEHAVGRHPLDLDRLVALEPRDDLRVRLVGEEGPERLSHLALVVVEQELDPLGVVEGLLVRRDRQQPLRRLTEIGLARLEARGVAGLFRDLLRVRECPGGDRVEGIAVGRLHQRGRELQCGQRRDDALDAVDLPQAGLDVAELLDPVAREDRVDLLPVGHRDAGEHRLAAEDVLVRDVVLVDLRVGVQVAVLAGREIDPGDAETDDDREDEPDRGDDAGVPGEADR